MNSVERVHAALKLKQPDRVPVMEFLVDEKIAAAAVPGCIDVADCMDRLGLDAAGCGALFKRVRENSDGTFVDEWGVTYKGGPEAIAHPLKGVIHSMDDARAYTAPDPNVPWRLGKLPDIVERYKGKRAITFHHRAAFMWSAFLMDIEELLINMLVDKDIVEIVFDKVLDANMAVVRNAIRAGAEVIVLGDDYASNAGPMMSPQIFGEMILPRLKKMINMIHEEGAFCIKHTDGNIYPILDMIISAQPDGLNPIEPVAGMELSKVKEICGDTTCLIGNIDCAHLLPHGTKEEVREAVRKAIGDAAAGGGFMVSSSNSIHSSCNPENFVAMIEAVKEFGAY